MTTSLTRSASRASQSSDTTSPTSCTFPARSTTSCTSLSRVADRISKVAHTDRQGWIVGNSQGFGVRLRQSSPPRVSRRPRRCHAVRRGDDPPQQPGTRDGTRVPAPPDAPGRRAGGAGLPQGRAVGDDPSTREAIKDAVWNHPGVEFYPTRGMIRPPAAQTALC